MYIESILKGISFTSSSFSNIVFLFYFKLLLLLLLFVDWVSLPFYLILFVSSLCYFPLYLPVL